MGRVLTNTMSLSFAREATLGVLPAQPTWFQLEPNTITGFGTTVGTTVRNPISKSRARRKGVVTDADTAVQFEADLTLTHLRDFAEVFLFARAVGADSYIATMANTLAGYVVTNQLSIGQAARLIYTDNGAKSLVWAHGFSIPSNNGLRVLSAGQVGGNLSLPVAGLVNETIANGVLAEASICGVRAAAGDLAIDANGNITSTQLDFTTLGIVPGQVIHVGGVDVLHQFGTLADNAFARVAIVAPHLLTLVKRDAPFAADAGTGIAVDLLFGQFIRNVDADSPDFQQTSLQFELHSPGLMNDGSDANEYALGCYANTLSLAIPLTGKATITLAFVGKTTTTPSNARATNAASAKVGGLTGAYGTASDIARLRVQDVDESGLSTDFKSATFALNNNVSGEKVLGNLGPKYLNAGNIECSIENQMLFTSPDVLERINCNKTVGFDTVLRNGDGGFALDLPTGTLTGRGREYPVNQSVLLNDTFNAYQDSDGPGFTCGISIFPVLPVPVC